MKSVHAFRELYQASKAKHPTPPVPPIEQQYLNDASNNDWIEKEDDFTCFQRNCDIVLHDKSGSDPLDDHGMFLPVHDDVCNAGDPPLDPYDLNHESTLVWNEIDDLSTLFQKDGNIVCNWAPIFDTFDDFDLTWMASDSDSCSDMVIDILMNMPDEEFSLVVAGLYEV
jgi:hypothetical protein